MERNLPRRRLVHDELTRTIIGAFYDVYNALGFGFLEQIYMNALAIALERAGLLVERERVYDVPFRDVTVGRHRVDMLVEKSVLVEGKATHVIVDADRRQTMNYLRCTQLDVALLLHFGPRPSFQRIVMGEEFTRSRNSSRGGEDAATSTRVHSGNCLITDDAEPRG